MQHLVAAPGRGIPCESVAIGRLFHFVQVMNAHARLDVRNPRLVSAMLREMAPFFRELSKEPVPRSGVGSRKGKPRVLVSCLLRGRALGGNVLCCHRRG